MILREHLASQYVFYRFPNMHIIFLIPLIPSITVVFLRNNLYMSSAATFGAVGTIIEGLLRDYFFYFKLVLSVVTSFFFVYRWAQMKADRSYGFWITQGVHRHKFILYAVLSFSLLISVSELTGFIILDLYLGFYLPVSKIFLIILGIFLNNILFTITAVLLSEILFRPEISGLVFIALAFLNYTLLTNNEQVMTVVLQLEMNYNSPLFPIAIFVEILLILLMAAPVIYLQETQDILA